MPFVTLLMMQAAVKAGMPYELASVPMAMLRFEFVRGRGRAARGDKGVAARIAVMTKLFEEAWAICARHNMCIFFGACPLVRHSARSPPLSAASLLCTALSPPMPTQTPPPIKTHTQHPPRVSKNTHAPACVRRCSWCRAKAPPLRRPPSSPASRTSCACGATRSPRPWRSAPPCTAAPPPLRRTGCGTSRLPARCASSRGAVRHSRWARCAYAWARAWRSRPPRCSRALGTQSRRRGCRAQTSAPARCC